MSQEEFKKQLTKDIAKIRRDKEREVNTYVIQAQIRMKGKHNRRRFKIDYAEK